MWYKTTYPFCYQTLYIIFSKVIRMWASFCIFVSFFGWYCLLTFHISYGTSWKNDYCFSFLDRPFPLVILSLVAEAISIVFSLKSTNWLQNEKTHLVIVVGCLSWHLSPNARRSWWKRTLVQGGSLDHWPVRLLSLAGFLGWLHTADADGQTGAPSRS